MVQALLRYFGVLYHGLLAVFLLAVSGLALASGGKLLRLDMLPWTGSTLSYVVFFGSLVGLAAAVLAAMGKLKPLFLVWSVAVLVLMVKGYIFSSYYFEKGELRPALLLMGGALLAAVGAWFQMSSRTAAKRY